MSCPTATRCVAVADSSNPVIETSDGSTLDIPTLPDPGTGFFGVSCVAVNTCDVVSENQGLGALVVQLTPSAPLRVTTPSLPRGSLNTPYRAEMTGSGGYLPYSWRVSSGAPPPGLELSGSGTWCGTPTRAGTYWFTVEAGESDGVSLDTMFSITIAP